MKACKPVEMFGTRTIHQVRDDYDRIYGAGPAMWAGRPVKKAT